MKKIYENELVLVYLLVDGTIKIVNKMSEDTDLQLNVKPFEDGHLEIKAPNCRFHPTEKGFDLWLQ